MSSVLTLNSNKEWLIMLKSKLLRKNAHMHLPEAKGSEHLFIDYFQETDSIRSSVMSAFLKIYFAERLIDIDLIRT